MSRRYEFFGDEAELIEGEDLLELGEDAIDEETVANGMVALVIGNPYATAGVLCGSRDSIAATLHRWLRLLDRP